MVLYNYGLIIATISSAITTRSSRYFILFGRGSMYLCRVKHKQNYNYGRKDIGQ